MKVPAGFGLYGLILAAVFAVGAATAGAVVPEETVRNWTEETTDDHAEEHETAAGGHEGQVEEADGRRDFLNRYH